MLRHRVATALQCRVSGRAETLELALLRAMGKVKPVLETVDLGAKLKKVTEGKN